MHRRLRTIGDLLNCDAVTCIHPITPPFDDFVRDLIEDIQPKKKSLLVILETEGGSIETAERIADAIFRHHYPTDVCFLIPNSVLAASHDPLNFKMRHYHDVGFATKPQIARRMIARALAANVPFSFVATDTVYGTGDVETQLRKAGKGYVLGVAANHAFNSWGKKLFVRGSAAKIAQSLPKNAWRRLSSGEGTKGPRLHDWAYLEPADLDIGEYNSTLKGKWTPGMLVRRNLGDGDLAFFSTWCPKGTSMAKLVSVEGHRWAIEDSFETAKNELGLDHNESRSWHGWHRHVSLVMLAFAMMAAIRHKANATSLKKTPPRLTTKRRS